KLQAPQRFFKSERGQPFREDRGLHEGQEVARHYHIEVYYIVVASRLTKSEQRDGFNVRAGSRPTSPMRSAAICRKTASKPTSAEIAVSASVEGCRIGSG